MADYVNTDNTFGFYKFNKFPDWSYNSISIDNGIAWNYNLKYGYSSGGYTFYTNQTPTSEKKIYRSRPSSILLPESTCIMGNLSSSLRDNNTLVVNNGSYGGIRNLLHAFTVEFWVYIKKGVNNNEATSYNSVNTYVSANQLGSNPFLFTYGRINNNANDRSIYYSYFNDSGWNNKSVTKYYESGMHISLSYDCYYKRFFYKGISNRATVVSGYINQSYTPGYSTLQFSTLTPSNTFPPNRWYHIALTFENGVDTNSTNPYGKSQTRLFIDGKKRAEHSIGRYAENSNGIHLASNPIFQDDGSYISIGNRLAGNTSNPPDNQDGGFIYNFKSQDPSKSTSNTLFYLEKPGFQDIIIDDLRITKGVLYTTDFTPPGITGYELLNVDDEVYGYNKDTYEFDKIDSNWSSKSNTEKWTTIQMMTDYMQITADDIRSVVTPTSNDIHMEVYYPDESQKNCYVIEASYETTVKPSSLLTNPLPGSDIKKIDFTYSLSDSSFIKVLLTTDLITYKSYDFTNNTFVITDIADIATNGIPIDQVKNIPESDVMSLGDNFAFAYYLYLEPYEADCHLSKIALDVSLTYAQKHCNQTIANYEYPMFNKLKVVFYEDGEYKVNYMDKP